MELSCKQVQVLVNKREEREFTVYAIKRDLQRTNRPELKSKYSKRFCSMQKLALNLHYDVGRHQDTTDLIHALFRFRCDFPD